MTRENKAGLVVASCFLALVGVVLAMKLREPAAPAGEGPAPPLSVQSVKAEEAQKGDGDDAAAAAPRSSDKSRPVKLVGVVTPGDTHEAPVKPAGHKGSSVGKSGLSEKADAPVTVPPPPSAPALSGAELPPPPATPPEAPAGIKPGPKGANPDKVKVVTPEAPVELPGAPSGPPATEKPKGGTPPPLPPLVGAPPAPVEGPPGAPEKPADVRPLPPLVGAPPAPVEAPPGAAEKPRGVTPAAPPAAKGAAPAGKALPPLGHDAEVIPPPPPPPGTKAAPTPPSPLPPPPAVEGPEVPATPPKSPTKKPALGASGKKLPRRGTFPRSAVNPEGPAPLPGAEMPGGLAPPTPPVVDTPPAPVVGPPGAVEQPTKAAPLPPLKGGPPAPVEGPPGAPEKPADVRPLPPLVGAPPAPVEAPPGAAEKPRGVTPAAPPAAKGAAPAGKALPPLGHDAEVIPPPPPPPGTMAAPEKAITPPPAASKVQAVKEKSAALAPPAPAKTSPLKIKGKKQPPEERASGKAGPDGGTGMAKVTLATPVTPGGVAESGAAGTPAPTKPESIPELTGKPLPPIGADAPPTVPVIKHGKPDAPPPDARIRPLKPTAPPSVIESRTPPAPPPSASEDRTSSGKPLERSSFTPASSSMATPDVRPSRAPQLGTPRPAVRVIDENVRPASGTTPAREPGRLDTISLRPTMPAAPAGFRVETAIARLGDTWDTLSTRYYGNDRCAAALQAFNRDYEFSSPRLRHEGTFAARDAVFIPPASVLVSRYGRLIRVPSPAAPVPPPAPYRAGGF